MSFEWQTDEDERQEEVAATISSQTAVSRRRSRWLLWVLLAVLLILAGWLVYRQANKRVATAVSETKTEILSSQQLVTQAAREQDRDLLVTLLSGRDDAWADAQISLGEEGLLFDRPQFGLSWQAEDAPRILEDQISLNSQLDAAEVTYPLTYTLAGGETVTLQQTAVYRRGAQRWLLSPPEAEFWGEERETETANITLRYPQRDEETAVRLAGSLQTALEGLCQLPDVNCPDDLQLTIRLETEPDSLLQTADFQTVLQAGRDLVLPTPTLVGLPLDDGAYEAVADGYAAQMVTAVLTDLVGYQCCDQLLFYQALLDWQLSELGLKAWPMSSQTYEQLLVDSLPPHLWNALWRQEPDSERNRQTVYALIEFIQTQIPSPPSAAKLQRELTRQDTFLNWLEAANGLTALDIVTSGFAETWEAFILAQIAAGQTAVPPIPYPPQPVQITCQSQIGSERIAILTYDPVDDQWQEMYARPIQSGGLGYIVPLNPAENLYLARDEPSPGSTQPYLFLVQNGQEVAAFGISQELPEQPGGIGFQANFDYAGSSPDGRYLLLAAGRGDPPIMAYRLLDVSACLNGDCQTWPLSGLVRWSPDGTQTILEERENNRFSFFAPLQPASLFLGDEKGGQLTEIGRGASPFWLDERTYGAIRFDEEGNMELVTAVVGEDEPRLRLPINELRQLIPADERPETLFVTVAFPSLEYPRAVVVRAVASERFEGDSYYFLLDLNEDFTAVASAELLGTADYYESTIGSSLSPDGRWHFLYEYVKRDLEATITLTARGEDAASFEPLTFPGRGRVVWAGEWFASVADDFLLLAAPAYDFRRIIPHDLTGCQPAYWPAP